MAIFKKKDDQEENVNEAELDDLKLSVINAKMPEQVENIALKEIEKLKKSNPATAEYTIGMNYIDYLISLPWNKTTKDNLDIKHAESILNKEHYGLPEIKDRILEHLAVRILKSSKKYNILVVEDEKIARANLEHVITKEGYHVKTAADGLEATNLLNQYHFDVILTDLKMDKIDGMGVLETAKQKDPNIEVIMITGYATVSTAVDAMKKGSFHFITKPFKVEEIRSIIKNALEKKRGKIESKGPALCFVGPPGTGKTSLGMSIARSLEKKFIRISLAGVKDEAEIRGHRRSYVGALPGRIIQEMRRVGSCNPVFMLDEIDKIGQDVKGDPASALLEVLDPEQQAHFIDHYLDVPFSLSNVMFIATANTTDPIPGPLLDRFELLTLSGYTQEEKEKIACEYLIPKAINNAGLDDQPPTLSKESVGIIINEYTREAGLRSLQRQIDAVFRKTARDILSNGENKTLIDITPELVRQQLGPAKYFFEIAEAKERIGVTTGLAWTETGGQIIFIEATIMKGRSELILTGSLGNVMKESAQAALSYIRSHTEKYHIAENFFEHHDLHIHVPAGAIPKDGPSAGLTIAIALISLLTQRPCKRDVALTGELTLSGRILPVGGVKEKILAAHRAGVKTIVFPAKNDADLKNIPLEISQNMKIIPINELDEIVDQVLKAA
ncbi:MAG: endopeptidase La [Candidatus Magnetomorum sp.]|nr:endopeptidase La [Candidatus Magnetomorum sp.]